MAGLFRSFRIK